MRTETGRAQADFSTSACFPQLCPTMLSNFCILSNVISYCEQACTIFHLLEIHYYFLWIECSYPLHTILWIVDIFAFPSLTYFTCVLVLEFRYRSGFTFSGWLPSCPNIIYKIVHLLISFRCRLFFLSFGHAPWHEGILVPWWGIESMPPDLEAWNLNQWTATEIPQMPPLSY